MVMDREERRRRIMERGSDRLALITGQIHNLDDPSSPSAASASHNRTYSEFTPQTKSDDIRQIQESPSLKYQFREEPKVSEEPKVREEPKLSQERVLPKPLKTEPKKPQEPRSVKSQSQRTKSVFSSKKLSASITSSERTRSLSSLTIAAMVVLLPRLNILRSSTILALRPLWLLLLTDCAIVMSHIIDMEASGGGSGREMEEDVKGNNGGNWTDAEKLLERGVVAYQALRALFIDCSLYMVIVVICGL